ncbi:Uma2 family endonuclease [bacterium]|nr:Uma2 family endonuclease [bacterium]
MVATLPSVTMTSPPWPIYRLSVETYERMVATGAFNEDDPVELLEGYLVPKMPKNPLHDSSVDLLQNLLLQLVRSGWYVRTQNVLSTDDSMPEPDLAVVRGMPAMYRTQHPCGRDVGLVIEVADTSIRRDRHKAEIYARAGVPEYWVVNLEEWQLERMTEPQPTGHYQATTIFQAHQQVPLQLDGQPLGHLDLRELLTPPTDPH